MEPLRKKTLGSDNTAFNINCDNINMTNEITNKEEKATAVWQYLGDMKDSERRRITTGRRSSKYHRDYWQNKGKNHERGALEEG